MFILQITIILQLQKTQGAHNKSGLHSSSKFQMPAMCRQYAFESFARIAIVL